MRTLVHFWIAIGCLLSFHCSCTGQTDSLRQDIRLKLTSESLQKIIVLEHSSTYSGSSKGARYEISKEEGNWWVFQTKRYERSPSSVQIDSSSAAFQLANSEKKVKLHKLSVAKIEELVRTIGDSPLDTLGRQNFGITKLWIEQNHMRLAVSTLPSWTKYPDKIRDACIEQFKDSTSYINIIRQLTSSNAGQSANSYEIRFVMADDSYSLFSANNSPYMLPWSGAIFKGDAEADIDLQRVIDKHKIDQIFYDPLIIKWIASVLPSSSSLASTATESKVEQWISNAIFEKNCASRFPTEVRKHLRGTYLRESTLTYDKLARITSRYTIDLAGFSEETSTVHLFLSADETIPSYVTCQAGLRLKNGKLRRTKKVRTCLPKQIRRVVSHSFIAERQAKIEILSMGFFTSRFFEDQQGYLIMDNLKQSGLEEAFLGNWKKMVLFRIIEKQGGKHFSSDWILTNDGRLILWKYRGEGVFDLEDIEPRYEGEGPLTEKVVFKEI